MPNALSSLTQVKIPKALPTTGPYSIELLGKNYQFKDLKEVLGNADFSKAGDRNAGLAANDEVTREAARSLLSSLTLQHLYDHPLTDDTGNVDSVMRVNYDID